MADSNTTTPPGDGTASAAPVRDARGRFPPGASGNPRGRGKAEAQVRDAAREHTARCIELLMGIAEDTLLDPRARVVAIQEVLNRGHGKPSQTIEHTGADGGPIDVHNTIRSGLMEKLDRLVDSIQGDENGQPAARATGGDSRSAE